MTKRDDKTKLDEIINELSVFLEKDFSSRFRYLSEKEDRQLFFLAQITVKLKQLSRTMKDESPRRNLIERKTGNVLFLQ